LSCALHLFPTRRSSDLFFTTDTAGALRAVEIGADAIMKATKVDGIYSADPKRDKTAARLPHITYREVLSRGLEVMDTTAISLCIDRKSTRLNSSHEWTS